MACLTREERRCYDEQGFVIPSFRLSDERIDYLRTVLDKLIADNPDVRPEKLVSAHIDGQNDEGVRGNAAFLELAKDADLLDMVEDAIGSNIILWGCHVFCKPGGDGLETPWHQDGHYWPIRPLATCTVWVALDHSTRENGCLRVIPRSHRGRRLFTHLMENREDLVLTQRTAEGAFDEDSAVDLELEPGQMSMHDVYLVHGAAANVSPKRRAGVALRYMPASSVFDRAVRPASDQSGIPVSFASRPLWLLRGHDQTGQNDFSVGHK
ncbi:MAG: phytanoyl-CoA dioxygenase family protein [Hyphomicrobiaceae bacterium]